MTDTNLVKPEFGSLPELATRIKSHHAAVREAAKNVVQKAIMAGAALNEAKAKLSHGEWLPWLEEHCELSEWTAHNYMLLAANKHKLEFAVDANLTLNQALRQICGSGRVTVAGPESKYNKAQATLLDKLRQLLPEDVEGAATRTITELQATVTELKKPVSKAA